MNITSLILKESIQKGVVFTSLKTVLNYIETYSMCYMYVLCVCVWKILRKNSKSQNVCLNFLESCYSFENLNDYLSFKCSMVI